MVGKYLLRSGSLVPSWNPTTWETEAEGFWMLQGQPVLHRDLVSNKRQNKTKQQKVPRELLSQKWGLCPASCTTRTQSQSKGQGFQGWLHLSGAFSDSGVHLLPLGLSV